MKKVRKFLLIIFLVGFCILIFFILKLFGIIQEYSYINIDDNNKETIKILLKDQEKNMHNKSEGINFEQCINSMKKIEIEFSFPYSENFQIYCDDNTYYFSLDNPSYDIVNYFNENSKTWYRFFQ